MKEFIRQFYNEGFATTFIKKPIKLEELRKISIYYLIIKNMMTLKK